MTDELEAVVWRVAEGTESGGGRGGGDVVCYDWRLTDFCGAGCSCCVWRDGGGLADVD